MKKIFFVFLSALTLALSPKQSFAGDATLISKGSPWRYLDNGTDQSTGWQTVGFDDSSWLSGASELGYGDGDEATTVGFGPDANNKYITTYFRKTFNVNEVGLFKSLLLSIRCDDGVVIYINGTEVTRHNMPAGAITYTTLAASNTANQFELNYTRFNIAPSLLVNGTNTIAVEIHQDAITSSDLSFNMELIASREATIVAQGDVWKYLDNGTDQGTSWNTDVFDDLTWASGKSTFGYSTGAVTTQLENTTNSYGPSSSTKYVTTYFRRTVTIADTALLNPSLSCRVFLDDGCVIYVNGVEAVRRNMPTGTIAYNTLANVTVGTAAWLSVTINKNLFRSGDNIIAVETHQSTLNSSDMFFELEIKETSLPFAGNTGCSNPLSIDCFTAVPASSQTGELVIPSTHTFQYLMKQGDLYTNPISGITAMPTNNDYTAFLPIAGSSEHGYLSINHENSPGGVSILEMTYNQYTGLWQVNNSQPVDYAPVVKSIRNCSGGITPWGTVVSSEEDVTAGDANTDGYQDVGWHVEIDPVTKAIKDQDGNSTPDKLWAMGRSNKENICFSSDSVTSYFGLDAGSTSYMYKFVASQPANLSAGTLYVLKQDVFLSNTAYWVVVPNTTQSDRNNCISVSTSLGARSYNKVEDVEIGPDGKIYFTSSNDSRIYRFSDTPSITDFEIYVQGGNFTYTTASGVSTGNFANCDNLVFDPEGNLYVNVDGNTNPLWVVRPGHSSLNPKIEQFAKPPAGSESTGTTFSPDGRFMFVSIQHPNAGNTFVNVDAAGTNQIINKAYTIVIARKEHLGPMAAIPFVELGTNITTCQGQTVTLDAGAGHASYAWSTGATTQTISVSANGTYSVTVTGANGRTNADNITINVNTLPSTPTATNATYCLGATILPLTASGSNVKWYSDASLTTQVATGNTFATGNSTVGSASYYLTQTDGNGCTSLPSSVTEVINALPSAPASANAAVCSGASVPDLTASGTNVLWYSDAALTTQVASGNTFATGNTSAGVYTYYATQTDANGCKSASASSVLTINALPSAPVTSDQAVCSLQSNPSLNASGSNVIWYSNASLTTQVATANSFTPTDNVVGTYTYYSTQTDANGCVSPAAVATLSINALPAAPTASGQTVCEYDVIPSLSATGTNMIWYSDVALATQVATGASFATGNTAPGTYLYYLTQTDGNGCTSGSAMVSLVINARPSDPAVSSATVCEASPTPDLTATGTTIVWYSDFALTTQVATGNSFATGNTSAGIYTYYATQTDVNGCASNPVSSVLTIYAQPAAPVAADHAVCFNEANPALNSTGTNVIWYSDASLTTQVATGNNYIPTDNIAGAYAYYLTQTDGNGCSSFASTATLTIYALPTAPGVSNQTVCEYDLIPSLNATGTNVVWYSDAALLSQVSTGNNFSTGNTAAGTYTYYVTQTDANTCTSPSAAIALQINATPVQPVITGPVQYCAGDALQALNATGTTITWYADAGLTSVIGTGNSYVPSGSGIFYATETVSSCVSAAATTTVVVNALPSVSMSGLNANYFSTDAAVSMMGTPAGGTFSGTGVSGNMFDPAIAGVGGPYSITYTYTDANGCSNTSSFDVTVNLATGLTAFSDGSEISVFPNPANDQTFVNLHLNKETLVSMNIYDVTGRAIMLINNQKMVAGANKIEINKSDLNLSGGTYWINVSTENETKTIKIIFQ